MRIIAGKWRSRRLPVADIPGLRPTGDRIRETLFNWIGPRIIGSRVLDPFAGSGALGFEAASRGAGEVVMLDQNAATVEQLRQCKLLLNAEEVQVLQGNAISYLETRPDRPFDWVFLDPPFESELLVPTLELVSRPGWLSNVAAIYMEFSRSVKAPSLPEGWAWHREKTAGDVHFGLISRSQDGPA